MKIKTLIVSSIFCLSAIIGYSQSITYKANNKSLVSILEEIENTYDIHFSYPTRLLKQKYSSINVSNCEIHTFLDSLLPQHLITFKETRKGFFILKSLKKSGYTLKAIVSNGKSSLPYADISIEDSQNGTITNANGEFSIKIDHPEACSIKISYLGYEPYYINAVEFYKNRETEIVLKPKQFELKPVNISEYINTGIIYDNTQQIVKLTPRKMEIIPGYNHPGLVQILKMIPGINSNSESASEINFRGSHRDANLVYYDNIPIYNTGQLYGILSRLSIDNVTDIEVHKKGIPSEYSEATSGLVKINSINKISKKREFSVRLNLHDIQLYTSLPIIKDKLSIYFSATQSINKLLNSPGFVPHSIKLFNQTDPLNTDKTIAIKAPNMQGNYSSSTLSGMYMINNKHTIKISTYFNTDTIQVETKIKALEENISTRSTSSGGSFQLNSNINKNLKSQISYAISHYHSLDKLSRQHGINTHIQQTNNLLANELKFKLKYNTSKHHSLTTGVSTTYLQDNLTKQLNQRINNISNNTNFSINIFIDDNIKIFDNLSIYPGFKTSYFNSVNKFKILPNLKLQYQPIEHLNLNASFGQSCKQIRSFHYLNPEIIEIAQTNILLSSDKIPMLENTEYTLGAWYSDKGLLLEIEFYNTTQKGILLYAPYINTSTNNIEAGILKINGFDLMVRKRFRHYRTWISYTYNTSKNKFDNLSSDFFTGFNDRPHQLQWTHSIHMGQYEFSVGYNYKSGKPYSEPTAITNTSGGITLSWDELNTQRLSSYSRIDASISYKFPRSPHKGWKGKAGISIINLYNTQNIWYKHYQIIETNTGNYEIKTYDKQLLGISPNISVKIDF